MLEEDLHLLAAHDRLTEFGGVGRGLRSDFLLQDVTDFLDARVKRFYLLVLEQHVVLVNLLEGPKQQRDSSDLEEHDQAQGVTPLLQEQDDYIREDFLVEPVLQRLREPDKQQVPCRERYSLQKLVAV